MEIKKEVMTEPERFPAVKMYLGHIDQAVQGLTGVGMVLNALLIGGDYETPEDRLIDNQRLTGGLYSCIEALAWSVSMELAHIEASLEMYEGKLKDNKREYLYGCIDDICEFGGEAKVEKTSIVVSAIRDGCLEVKEGGEKATENQEN